MSEDAPDPDDLRERLADLTDRLDAAEAEADYRAIDEELDAVEADLTALEEAVDEDDEEALEPVEELGDELEEVAETLEEMRGPYAEDVRAVLEAVSETVDAEEWTEDGESAVIEAVKRFVVVEGLPESPDPPEGIEEVGPRLQAIGESIGAADLDPDDDAETIETLLEAAESLRDAVDAAETWDDLSVRERLDAHGFYDVLDHRKDYPPEWSALKAHEKAGNAEMILLAYDLLDSEFMEEHCLEAFKRLGSPEALDAMVQQAQRRDRDAIEVLGRIGDEEPVDMLVEYLGEGPARPLELTILRSLGMIGSPAATQAVADRLVADDPLVRSTAARALGMIGDTRAIAPLAEALDDDEAGNVRASAAWALNAIGTHEALEAASGYADDREYLVEVQAERAREALEAT